MNGVMGSNDLESNYGIVSYKLQTQSNVASNNKHSGVKLWVIIAAAVGGLLLIAAVATIVVIMIVRRYLSYNISTTYFI